jgi:DNA-binding XRE family transcriptional regulator
MSNVIDELENARKAAGLTHEALAQRAGVSRMTVQRTEAGKIDPRLSTLSVLARSLGMDLMLVPKSLRPDLEDFVRSGGRFLGQPSGIGAPASLVDELLQVDTPAAKAKPKGKS